MDEKPKREQAASLNTKTVLTGIILALLVLMIAQLAYDYMSRRPVRSFDGEQWEVVVSSERVLDEAGQIQDFDFDYELVLEMTSNSNQLTGQYLGAEYPACGIASFEGTVVGDEMEWVVTYSGDCCGGAQMSFNGTIAADGQSIAGQFTPIGRPPEACWTWWADVQMTEAESD
jgi:hypothetical protein